MAHNATYLVTGMTCQHCVTSVTAAISAVPGVHDVAVDLAAGSVEVSGEGPLDQTTIAAAVRDAGYELQQR